MSEIYGAKFIDSFAASFCTFFKTYYGSQVDIATVYDALKIEPRYRPSLIPVKVISTREIHVGDVDMKFQNVWDCTYHVKGKGAKAGLDYIEHDNAFFRCAKVSMRNVACESVARPGNWISISANDCWGIPHFEDGPDGLLTAKLYFEEKKFASKVEPEEDIAHPTPVDLNGFWQDVFADG